LDKIIIFTQPLVKRVSVTDMWRYKDRSS